MWFIFIDRIQEIEEGKGDKVAKKSCGHGWVDREPGAGSTLPLSQLIAKSPKRFITKINNNSVSSEHSAGPLRLHSNSAHSKYLEQEMQQQLGNANLILHSLQAVSEKLIIIKLPSFISNYLFPQQGFSKHQAKGKQVSKA